MDRKEIEGKKIKRRKHYNISRIIMLNIVGIVFIVAGIAILIFSIKGVVESGEGFQAWLFLPIIMGLFFCVASVVVLRWAWKDIYNWRKKRLTKKYGDEGFAVIIDTHYVEISDRKRQTAFDPIFRDRYFGFTLSYEQDGERKIFKTDAVNDINEFEYLTSLDKIKIKIYKNYVAINEEFGNEIYTKDPATEMDKSFFEEKPFSTVKKIGKICDILSIIIFLVLFALAAILKSNIFLYIGLAVVISVITGTSITYLYYIFKGKKK